MNTSNLQETLCKGVENIVEEGNDYQKVEKVLAPFLRTLKVREKVKADVLPEEYKELYLKRNPKELLMRLQNSFVDPVEIKTLLNETAELLKIVTQSKSVNLYLTDYDRGEILLCPKYVQKDKRFERKYSIESGTYVAAHVAFTKEYVISSDILGDVRFPQGIPFVGPTVKSVICLPIITNVQDNCIGVIELYRDYSDKSYNLTNLQICNALTAWMGIALEQNTARLLLLKQMEIQAQLSHLAKLYFSGAINFNKIVSDVLKITKAAVSAEKGGFYVFQEPIPLNSKDTLYADAYEEGSDEYNEVILYKRRTRIRFGKNEPGIPGYAARSGEVINVVDAYKDYRFDRKTDSPFFRTQSVVAFPIKNDLGVLAVMKLINSLDYPFFRKEDIDSVLSYANYIALICGYYLLDSSCNKTNLRLSIANKLLDYHMKPPIDEITGLKTFVQIEQQLPRGFFRFEWDPSNFEDDAHKYVAYVLLSSDILEPCFDFQNLANFLLRVKKAHRPVFYHNFEHAFCVFHCAYNIIAKNKDVFSTVEIVTILLAALCHDVDHDGYTNSFLNLTKDNIFKLYGDFCGEAHRHEVCMFLIQSSDLLSNFSAQNYQIICKGLRKLMLSFDMAIYFQNIATISDILNSNSFQWDNPEHKYLIHNMILICSDFSTNYKGFEVVRKYTSNYYKELYKQGDLEKSMGYAPLPILDRNKVHLIPESQIILLTVVCMPCIKVLVAVMPNLFLLSDLLDQTISGWKETVSLRGQEMWKLNQALVKEKKDRRQHRITLSSTISSIRTIVSDSRSDK